MKDLSGPTAHGMNNLLYSADADFSCFADLALVSPVDYYKEGQGSLMQVGAGLLPEARDALRLLARFRLHYRHPRRRSLPAICVCLRVVLLQCLLTRAAPY
jgi:zeta-carotene desaturase